MRASILEALQQEGHVSGEQLGKRLNISRTAVWKHIRELRRKGYEIGSSPRSGYCFIKAGDLLLPEEIGLHLSTDVIGKRIVYREEVSSTQDLAEELARQGVEEGVVVVCEKQTKGRGRRGRAWASPARGGVYLSIVLRPNISPGEAPKIALVAAVAVIRAIKEVAPLQPRIKWPNDIMLDGKKVGGILAEMACEMDRVNYIILGVGLNVNTQRSLLPESIRKTATSLAEECGECVSRVRFVQAFLAMFEKLYREMVVSGFGRIREEWKTLDDTIGSRVAISGLHEDIEGEALDISEDGFLLVRGQNGEIARIISGDVSLRSLNR